MRRDPGLGVTGQSLAYWVLGRRLDRFPVNGPEIARNFRLIKDWL